MLGLTVARGPARRTLLLKAVFRSPILVATYSYATTAGNSFYHGLQTKAEKRFANGLNFLATYT